MAIKYLAGDRLIGTAAERTALTSGVSTAGCLGFWNMQQQVTVGSAQHSQTDTGAPTQNDFSDVSMLRSKINTGHADIGNTINRVDVNIGKAEKLIWEKEPFRRPDYQEWRERRENKDKVKELDTYHSDNTYEDEDDFY